MHSPLGIRTELLLGDGTWEDISTRVRREGGQGIRISRGRRDERGRTTTSVNLTLEDPDGDFNDLNPMSPYYGLIGPNTQMRISLGNSAALEDDFNRLVSNGWTGGSFPWTLSGGTNPDDYDINGTKGLHTHPSTNSNHFGYTDCGNVNHRVKTIVNLGVGTLTGAGATARVHARMTDTSNWYSAFLAYTTAGEVTLRLAKTVLGVGTAFNDSVVIGTFANLAATQLALELYVEGNKLYAKSWDISESEPTNWQIADTDDDLTSGTIVGVSSRRETGNTNANLIVAFDSFLGVPGTIRAHVEVPNFGASRWTPGGFDVTMALQGAGIKRRLGSGGATSLRSPMYRYITRSDTSDIVGYWPCEDSRLTSQVGSGVGGPSLNVRGTNISFGASSPFPGTASMIALGDGASLSAPNLVSPDTGELRAQMLIDFPDAGLTDGAELMLLTQVKDATVRKWYLIYGTGGSLRLTAYSQSFALVEDSGPIGFDVDGRSLMVHFKVAQDGADVDWEIRTEEILPDGSPSPLSSSGTFTGSSVGACTGLAIAPTGGMDGCSVGQIVVLNDFGSLDGFEEAMIGHLGEGTTTRFRRLCDEEGVPYEVIGNSPGMQMGPQRIATLLRNLEDCEDAEHGIIYEARHFFGLVLRVHATMLGQSGPEFSYTAGHLTGEPFPVPDEALIANDVTASRTAGSEYRSVEESGPMSVLDPPDGIGRYDRIVPVNLQGDTGLPDIARWNRNVGTWRGPRHPSITFDTHRMVFVDDTALSADVDELELADFFSVDDLPAWLPPERMEVLAQGYTERIANLTREIVFNTVPAGPYQVAVRGTYRRDSYSTVLAEALDTTETDMNVTVTGPLWGTGAVNFNVMVAGELMTVTNISGASNPQTFTVTRSVNGIVKVHDSPTPVPVHVHPLPIRALSNDGGLNVLGRVTQPAVWVEGETTGTFTSSTYVADTDPVGVVFKVPPSGSFAVQIAGALHNDNAGGSTLMSFSIRLGSVIGEGFELVAPDDSRSILILSTDVPRIAKTFIYEAFPGFIYTGRDVNVTLYHRRATAGNASVQRRLLLVRPVGTEGGLPGSLIEVEPDAQTDEQSASDTSTSTSYTTADMTTCGTAFVAPASGKVLVHISARLDHSTAAPAFVSFEVREGNVVGSGTVVLAADDTRSLMNHNTNEIMGGVTFPVTGLTSGADYNVRLMHKTTSGTLTLVNRFVNVEPVA